MRWLDCSRILGRWGGDCFLSKMQIENIFHLLLFVQWGKLWKSCFISKTENVFFFLLFVESNRKYILLLAFCRKWKSGFSSKVRIWKYECSFCFMWKVSTKSKRRKKNFDLEVSTKSKCIHFRQKAEDCIHFRHRYSTRSSRPVPMCGWHPASPHVFRE